MALSASSAAVERTLRPLGFVRHKRAWYRDRGEPINVVDIQLTPIGHEITLNVGLFDPAVHEIVWGEPAPESPDEALCCLRYVGALEELACEPSSVAQNSPRPSEGDE